VGNYVEQRYSKRDIFSYFISEVPTRNVSTTISDKYKNENCNKSFTTFLVSGDGFVNTGMFEGAWKSTSITGSVETARLFYGKFVDGQQLDHYMNGFKSGRLIVNMFAQGFVLQHF